MKFEWDFKKALLNIKKHRVSFEEAISIFNDPRILSIFDEEHSDEEDRWVSIGLNKKLKVLLVVHLFIEKSSKLTIRIISARKATKNEIKEYNS